MFVCRTVLHSVGWDGLGDAACMGWAESCTQDVGQRAFLFACQIVDFLFFPETKILDEASRQCSLCCVPFVGFGGTGWLFRCLLHSVCLHLVWSW